MESQRVAPAADFSISASPGSSQVKAGSTASYTITISPSNGFTGTVGMTATSIPSGPVPVFSPSSVSGSGKSTMTVPTSGLARITYTITVSGNSGALTHTTTVSLKIR